MTDPLDEAYPICPECLRPRELIDASDDSLAWVCDCGVEMIGTTGWRGS